MRERSIEAVLVRLVRDRGGLAIKLGGAWGRGLPDRLVLLPGGRMRFVELKAPGGRVSPLQRLYHRRLRELGFCAEVLDSVEGIHQWAAAL